MMDNSIYKLLKMIEDNGFICYIVGGYVRDYLLGIESHDIDIATNATPKDILGIFKDYGTTSFDYGNVVLDSANYHVEITTFRKDIIYLDNRRPDSFTYVSSINDDVLRRDFTINSLYMDKNEKIYDPLNSKNDINKRIIKMIGDPYIRIKEDSLRILRAIRFATVLNFKIDKDLQKAIVINKNLLKDLSYDRKKEELFKIFTNDNKKYGISLLKKLDLIDVLDLKDIKYANKTKDIIGIYAMCYGDGYNFTRTEKDIIKDVREIIPLKLNKEILYKYGFYPVSIVCDLMDYNKKKYAKEYEKLSIKDKSEINITGKEICDYLGIEPGSILKDIYKDLEDRILNNDIENTNEKIKEYLNKRL